MSEAILRNLESKVRTKRIVSGWQSKVFCLFVFLKLYREKDFRDTYIDKVIDKVKNSDYELKFSTTKNQDDIKAVYDIFGYKSEEFYICIYDYLNYLYDKWYKGSQEKQDMVASFYRKVVGKSMLYYKEEGCSLATFIQTSVRNECTLLWGKEFRYVYEDVDLGMVSDQPNLDSSMDLEDQIVLLLGSIKKHINMSKDLKDYISKSIVGNNGQYRNITINKYGKEVYRYKNTLFKNIVVWNDLKK